MTVAKNLAELQEQIRTRYSDLSKRLQQVAQYVIDNNNSVAFDTVAVIAKEANVPPSTLIRFANTFGFSGFNEMKQLFRTNLIKETASYTERVRLVREIGGENASIDRPKDILNEFARANAQAMQQLAAQTSADDLQHAIDLLKAADTIYVMGLGRSFSVATYLTYALRHIERRTVLVDGLGGMFREQLNVISDKDVVISVSFSPYAEETVMVNNTAAQAGAKQIVITDSQISPLATLSDVCFVVKETQVDAFRSQSATLCLAQSIAVGLAFQSQ
ncbi:MurR/RpiR family transcriptional regulator [Photobacterium alginatilyticum]|uniref:MurR/RpiR family transcriptional regulator n=1 Tax=Photobacterium alginatilyticum TaxID=1775171 RepID=UPI0040687518